MQGLSALRFGRFDIFHEDDVTPAHRLMIAIAVATIA